MALLGPNDEDRRKLHTEINQLINQRFLVTTVAITAFGVVMGMLAPRIPPTLSTGVGGFVFLVSTVLSLILFSLFLLSHYCKGMIRVYSTYLILKNASDWEVDWEKFRSHNYVGYTIPQTIVFLMLNAITSAFPFLISRVFSVPCEPTIGLIALLAVGGLTELLMLGMGFWKWFDREDKAKLHWKALDDG
jgi:hypothetical protein